jgi:recombination protein RecR
MSSLPEPLATLVAALNKLPGIGPRSAERLALHLVQTDADAVRRLAAALVEARASPAPCATIRAGRRGWSVWSSAPWTS